jgi:ATP-binding cassette subfamily C protein LapB
MTSDEKNTENNDLKKPEGGGKETSVSGDSGKAVGKITPVKRPATPEEAAAIAAEKKTTSSAGYTQPSQDHGSAHNPPDDLPLEAQRVSLDDPLMECLAILSSEHGRRTTAVALSAGLPIPKDGIATPGLFVRAAERVNMRARMIHRPFDSIVKSPNLPCILLLNGDQACILRKRTREGLSVTFPETPDEQTLIKEEKLSRLYRGYAFFVRPQPKADGRAGPDMIEEGRDWFWSAIWQHRKIYYEVILAAVMVNLFALASPLFVMNVYDRVIPNNAFQTLWVLAIGVMLAYFFDFLLKNVRAHFVDAAGRKADNVISRRIFQHILGMKMANRPPSVGMLAANLREFETLRDFFTSATVVTLIDFPFILLFIGLIWLIGGPLALVPAVLVPLVIIIGLLLQKPLNRAIQKSIQEGGYKSSVIFETLTGLETIKVQAAEGHTQRKWEELTEQASLTSIEARGWASLGVNFAAFATQMSSVGIVVLGTYLVSNGDVSIGALIACVILSGRAMAPLGQVAGLLTKFGQSREALTRLDELMKTPVERPAGTSFLSRPVADGSIAFHDVKFSYPGQTRPAIRNINFEINAGQHVGIIGAVGSGKTTIERLLLNLYQPDEGSVQIDGTDVRQIDPADLRRNIGVVQQNPYLFYGSVRDNITLGHETVPEAAVVRAAELSGVMDFLHDSEAGLDTPVGERGEMLSGGQRQAIAISRALLYDPPILIMDEPTASIDPASERRLYLHLQRLIEGKTLLLITHRSAVLGLVDNLILMDKGSIIDYGDRKAVLDKLQGRYYPNMEKKAKMSGPAKGAAGNVLKPGKDTDKDKGTETS